MRRVVSLLVILLLHQLLYFCYHHIAHGPQVVNSDRKQLSEVPDSTISLVDLYRASSQSSCWCTVECMDFLKKAKAIRDEMKGGIKAALQDGQGLQQKYNPPAIFGIQSAQAPAGAGHHQGYVHPGTIMGPGELSLLKQRASGAVEVDDIWRQALQDLKSSTPAQYSPHALPELHTEWEGPKIGHDELVEKDGVMVYKQVLMYIVTNDERYARNAANILDAWATMNKSFHGKNAPLNAGWGIASFARSAELLKHTWPGWSSSGVEGRFMSWVHKLIMPQLQHEMLNRLPLANWQTTVAECLAQLSILTGNKSLWDQAMSWWHKVMDAYITPCGECGETKRDLFHSQFGLGGLIQLAEMAWQQGVDLYSYRNNILFTAMEFHAYITNGGKPKECCYELKGVGFLPCGWEVGYNHYKGRMGWDMPNTAQMLSKHRPEKYVFHWGLGTLTHYRTAEVLYRRPVTT